MPPKPSPELERDVTTDETSEVAVDGLADEGEAAVGEQAKAKTPLFDGRAIAGELPGELHRPPPSAPVMALKILARTLALALLVALTAWLWPIYALAAWAWGRPPNVPRFARAGRYLRLIWTSHPPAPGLGLGTRVWLSLTVMRTLAFTPVWALAWFLDELLYAEQLRATPVVAPLIELSAARSGSTQLARYLEEDAQLAAPSLVQALFPYLWLWRLVPRTLGRLISEDQVRTKILTRIPPEFLERHEGDPFRTDTFEGAVYLAHFNHLALYLGPELLAHEFGPGALHNDNRELWEREFVEFFDTVARKTLIHAGLGPDGQPRRFFVKGHFLAAADALAGRYPDARFLAMIREPGPRLQSAINFLHVNAVDTVLGHVPWPWVAEGALASELSYCEHEHEWFTRPGGPHRCVLRFDAYVRDLEGAMTRVYRECLDSPTLPDFVPREHPPRERKHYSINRSLAELGIDEAALEGRLAAYVAWCRGG
ncbi:hypothetical protein DB30_02709 [Enhygromyxa salina]|uniref:Sulfotransferase family protein n=1 Tax=Enhygromyxa salina TaxID=215803 RepID=A0A0C2A7E3_9BACT|nr:hypothetical protein DB30_02709 [Enhygromyxa salina]